MKHIFAEKPSSVANLQVMSWTLTVHTRADSQRMQMLNRKTICHRCESVGAPQYQASSSPRQIEVRESGVRQDSEGAPCCS